MLQISRRDPDVSYDIKYITEALQDSVSPAMYFLPQLDNLNINSIYINPKGTRSSQLYPTLAHEGYPGHLYQTTYFADSDPDLIRYLIAPDGYVEGWATYCELFSYSYADTGTPCSTRLHRQITPQFYVCMRNVTSELMPLAGRKMT